MYWSVLSFLFRACPSRSLSRPSVRISVRACVRDCPCVCVCVCAYEACVDPLPVCDPIEKPFCSVHKNTSRRFDFFTDPLRLQPVSPSRRIGFTVFVGVVSVVRTSNNAMACATLKRSLDFEPPMCRPTKRQRCTPMSISPSSSPPNSSRSEYVSPHFGGDVVPKITAGKENEFFCLVNAV